MFETTTRHRKRSRTSSVSLKQNWFLWGYPVALLMYISSLVPFFLFKLKKNPENGIHEGIQSIQKDTKPAVIRKDQLQVFLTVLVWSISKLINLMTNMNSSINLMTLFLPAEQRALILTHYSTTLYIAPDPCFSLFSHFWAADAHPFLQAAYTSLSWSCRTVCYCLTPSLHQRYTHDIVIIK